MIDPCVNQPFSSTRVSFRMATASPPDQQDAVSTVEVPAEVDTQSQADADRSDLTPIQRKRLEEREKLRTNRFDVVTSFFMALILFIGTFTLMLFIVWLTTRKTTVIKPIEIVEENAAGRDDNAEGFERDFEPPGVEEVEELLEPTLADTIEAVTDAVSSVAASLDTMDTNATANSAGAGQGDSRPPGPEGEGEDIIPRFERWQLNFSAKGKQEYAKQLEFFGIELGAVGPPIQGVDYAFNLTGSPQTRRETDSTKEERLYFMWTSPSPLKRYDAALLQQAGVPMNAQRQMLKFIPDQLANQLYQIEMEYAQSNNNVTEVKRIKKTVFETNTAGAGYQFEVVEQRYR